MQRFMQRFRQRFWQIFGKEFGQDLGKYSDKGLDKIFKGCMLFYIKSTFMNLWPDLLHTIYKRIC